jgi:hypothetical protein
VSSYSVFSPKRSKKVTKVLQDINNTTPTTVDISITTRQQDLSDDFREFIRVHIFLIEGFTTTEEVLRGSTSNLEGVSRGNASNRIIAGENGNTVFESGDDGTNEKW